LVPTRNPQTLKPETQKEVQRYSFDHWGKGEANTFHSSRIKMPYFAKMAEMWV
jgi:hypothetical protein